MVVADVHSGRSGGHARHGQAFNSLPSGGDQPLDILDRDVTFDHHALDERGMAGVERGGHALRLLHRRHVRSIDDRQLLAKRRLNPFRPFETATAAGVTPHHVAGGRRRLRQPRQRSGEAAGAKAAEHLPSVPKFHGDPPCPR